jgi:hypothetical protein
MISTPTGFLNPPKFLPNTDRNQIFVIRNAADTTDLINVGNDSSNPRFECPNSTEMLGYSDAYTTLQWRILTSTGTIIAKTFIANGTPIGVASGEFTFGGDVSATVGAAGGAAALPATPLGYLDAFVGTTPVKIPYFSN